jgi:hypothetical protein
MSWQPAATAPKDGKYILGWLAERGPVVVFFNKHGRVWDDGDYLNANEDQLTHWMPLPAPPET